MAGLADQYQTALGRYLDPSVIARNIEAEWADLLLGKAVPVDPEDPLFPFSARTTAFFVETIARFATHLDAPKRILEVGAATGRVTWELARRFPTAQEITAVDTSPLFVELARGIVHPGPPPKFLPIPSGDASGHAYIDVQGALDGVSAAVRSANITFLQCGGEQVPRPHGHFDAIVCLNVLDRHPEPRMLVARMVELLAPGGTLILSSPHDWQEKYTPPRSWVRDLRLLFSEDAWTILDCLDQDYPLRMSPRIIWQFKTQTVIALQQQGS